MVQVGEGSDELFGGYDWFRAYMQSRQGSGDTLSVHLLPRAGQSPL